MLAKTFARGQIKIGDEAFVIAGLLAAGHENFNIFRPEISHFSGFRHAQAVDITLETAAINRDRQMVAAFQLDGFLQAQAPRGIERSDVRNRKRRPFFIRLPVNIDPVVAAVASRDDVKIHFHGELARQLLKRRRDIGRGDGAEPSPALKFNDFGFAFDDFPGARISAGFIAGEIIVKQHGRSGNEIIFCPSFGEVVVLRQRRALKAIHTQKANRGGKKGKTSPDG